MRGARGQRLAKAAGRCFSLGALAIVWQVADGGVTAWAHDNVVVHRRMAEESVLRLNNPFFIPYVYDVKEGSYGEDVPATRSLGHFYNPQTDSAPWFALGSGPAWQNSQEQYNAGVSEYANNNLSGTDAAFYRIGRALHFIQDMTSPAHTHDDQHATDEEDFENWGPSHIPSMDFSSVTPKYAAERSAAGFVKELARLVYDMTAYQVDIDENTGPQPTSVYKQMFPSLHWVDGGFFGDDVWEVDRIGTFDCYGNGVFCNDGWWVLDETKIEDSSGRGGSRRLRGNAYVENTGGNSAEPVPLIFNGQPNSSNETMLQLYGRLLYPEAIAYGAGLLQVFAEAVGAPPVATSTSTPTNTQPPGPTGTPTDTPTPPNTPTPPGPTQTPSVTPTGTPPALCPPVPATGCRTPAFAQRAKLSIRNKAERMADQLSWKWRNGAATSTADFGKPLANTNYALCVYDHGGSTPRLVISARAPAAGVCAGKPCWRALGDRGFKYQSAALLPDGLQKLILKAGAAGKAQVRAIARGPILALPPQTDGKVLQQDTKVIVQLVSDRPDCWQASFSAPASANTFYVFKDTAD
jgi:hypothetical protein